jgi:hypothetical protein
MDGKQISLKKNQNDEVPITFNLRVKVFISKTEREPKPDLFNNLFIKKFPSKDFSEDELRKIF